MAWGNRMHGRWIVDYEERVNPEVLRKKRVKKLQEQMKARGIGALLIYDPSYIQYATGTRHERLFTTQRFYRYALLPRDNDPILFEFVGVEYENRLAFAPWLKGRLKPSLIWQYSGPATEYQAKKWATDLKNTLKEEGVTDPLGVDRIDIHMIKALKDAKIDFVDGYPAIWAATNIKLDEELELMKVTAAITDASFLAGREAIKPGVTEYQIAGVISEKLYSLGCEGIECIVVASGGHTNPYLREITDKLVRFGDLVIFDIDPIGPLGYISDFARTFLCGDKATKEQKQIHRQCYEYLQSVLSKIKAGVTTADVAQAFPEDEHEAAGQQETTGLLHFAHGIGINLYEMPTITRAFSIKYPVEIKKNMVFAVETYAGTKGSQNGVRLEENVVVTDTGYELLSLCPFDERLMD